MLHNTPRYIKKAIIGYIMVFRGSIIKDFHKQNGFEDTRTE